MPPIPWPMWPQRWDSTKCGWVSIGISNSLGNTSPLGDWAPWALATSGGLGTMGFGLGAAIGVQFAKPDKDVILVAGDGSFRMNCQELITVSRYHLPIKIFLFDNGTLGMVRQCGASMAKTI